jgi:hypothetical protein
LRPAPSCYLEVKVMRKLLAIPLLVTLLAACGDGNKPNAAAPTPTAPHDLEGYSQGVKDYYGQPHEHPGPDGEGFGQDSEAEYHQPPKPPEAGVGDTITLTGTNLGIRMEVTVRGVERVRVGSRSYAAVELKLENTGPSIFEDSFRQATLDYGDGKQARVLTGRKVDCSRGFAGVVRITDEAPAEGCLLFDVPEGERPTRFQLALEQVPVTAGGIWHLR